MGKSISLKEKFNVTYSAPRSRRYSEPRRATGESSSVSQEPERVEKLKSTAFPGASVERANQGRVNSLGLASLKNPSGLWGRRDCPLAVQCLPLPGLTYSAGNIGLICDS